MAKEVKFIVKEDHGTFGERNITRFNPETKEKVTKKAQLKLQLGSWGEGKSAKWDIRPWAEDGTCDKGLTLSGDELEALYELLKKVAEEE